MDSEGTMLFYVLSLKGPFKRFVHRLCILESMLNLAVRVDLMYLGISLYLVDYGLIAVA